MRKSSIVVIVYVESNYLTNCKKSKLYKKDKKY